jgi:hypothetical protein
LGKKLFHGGLPTCKCHRLIPVISRQKITGLKEFGSGDLCDFFSITKDAEFGLSS